MTAVLAPRVRNKYMPHLSELLKDLGRVSKDADMFISGVSVDSRMAAKGDLFLACSGINNHGLDFIEKVIAKGVAAIAWEPSDKYKHVERIKCPKNIPVIAIPNLSAHQGMIADRFYQHPSKDLAVVGITGTDGKTSCSQFIAQVLSETNEIPCGVIGTIGYGMYGALVPGVHTTPGPLDVQKVLSDVREIGGKHAVMEVSSHALEQGRVNEVDFDIAVLTNLTQDHLDYHGTREAYADAKRKLFEKESLSHVVVNADDPFGIDLKEQCKSRVPCLAYGFHKDADVRGYGLMISAEGLRMRVKTPYGKGVLTSSLIGDFNAMNLLTVLSVLLCLDMPLAQALEYIKEIKPVAGRMERFGGGNKPLVIVDYAHTANALEQVLKTLRPITERELTCVFGCGGDRDKSKRPEMGRVAYELADNIFITDDNPRTENSMSIISDIMSGCKSDENVEVEQNRAAAIKLAINHAQKGDVVLIAGKGHETYQFIGSRQVPFDDRAEVKRVLRGQSIV
ncbi:MAG: UDP-N-acetylmuramoyl-L-alanyl-D-glutamate--2,6-diaminopimelate ligase [Gammaproteobacteria bacterium]|nr:MAG: UDP-N-acetylmuramoyl-L-alanyl-D-glutamate--2,6-diaminopimelate ligase [Gammaproteobacteria bacterium]